MACFSLTVTGNIEKRKPFSKHWYYFIIKSTKTEIARFTCKTTLSQANAKINRMRSTKWTCHKERSFASNYFLFWKFCFILRTFYKELIWCTNYPNVHVKLSLWNFIWGCFFPMSILILFDTNVSTSFMVSIFCSTPNSRVWSYRFNRPTKIYAELRCQKKQFNSWKKYFLVWHSLRFS